MSNSLKIKLLDNIGDKDFEELKSLIKQYVMYLFLKSKPKYANIDVDERKELIDMALNEFYSKNNLTILDPEDIDKIEEEINFQLDSANNLIKNPNSINCKTRYYILKDENRTVGFVQSQVIENKDRERTEGLRNLLYVEPKYSGKTGETIDTFGNSYFGFYSEALYQNISQWFGENGVNYEKITAGINMSHHIATYIKRKKFIPVDKNDKTLFLEKNLKKQLYRRSLDKIYRLYCSHELRTKELSASDIMLEINSTPELVFLTDKQKIGLVKCFLKEEEKEKFIGQIESIESKIETSRDDDER